MTTPAFLGRGFSFPLRLNSSSSAPSFTRDEDLVKESIRSILLTRVGERPFRLKGGVPYGTRIFTMLFDSAIDAAVDIGRYDAVRALGAWEPRIIVMSVDGQRALDVNSRLIGVSLTVTYRYRATNRVDNVVVPYRTQSQEG